MLWSACSATPVVAAPLCLGAGAVGSSLGISLFTPQAGAAASLVAGWPLDAPAADRAAARELAAQNSTTPRLPQQRLIIRPRPGPLRDHLLGSRPECIVASVINEKLATW